MKTGRITVVVALGATQTIAWASSYYMPAILGGPIANALHLPASVFFGLFSGALLLSAAVGPSVGRLIDRQGGRGLLATSNLVIATALLILAAAHGITGLAIAWTVLGVGIGMGLYDPAFACRRPTCADVGLQTENAGHRCSGQQDGPHHLGPRLIQIINQLVNPDH